MENKENMRNAGNIKHKAGCPINAGASAGAGVDAGRNTGSNPRSRAELEKYYRQSLKETKSKIKESVNNDNLIVQVINCISELDRSANLLSKRLREWYELFNPEFSRDVPDHEKFIELILLKKDRKRDGSMGADLKGKDLAEIMSFAKTVGEIYAVRKEKEEYLSRVMKQHCPNITAVAGTLIAAKLLEHAGSLKRLSEMTSSTIQLLGAEKALFRHMKTGARPPKHGIILQHPLLQQAKQSERGKAARVLSDKLSIAAKVDYFKGEFIGNRLKEEIDEKLG